MSAKIAADVLNHWSDDPRVAHLVTRPETGETVRFVDHPGCHFCEVLTGRYAERAKRRNPPDTSEPDA